MLGSRPSSPALKPSHHGGRFTGDPHHSDGFVSIPLGKNGAHTIRVPHIPSLQATQHEKAKAFDYFTRQIIPLQTILHPAEIISAFAQHFPINAMPADARAHAIAEKIKAAFFDINNLEGRGFFNSHGAPIPFWNDATDPRPRGLDYFRFIATVHPASIDPRLNGKPPVVVEYDLPLPQTLPLDSQNTASLTNLRTNLFPENAPGISPTHASHSTTPRPTTNANDDSNTSDDDNASCTSQSPNAPSPNTTINTPKMLRAMSHHSHNTSSSSFTYTGPLDFLDNQTSWSKLWPNPAPALVNPPGDGGIIDISPSIQNPCNMYHMLLFTDIFRLDYVGSHQKLDAKSIESIGARLRRYTMVYTTNNSPDQRYSSPDSIYHHYLEELPILPDDAQSWGFNLVNLFWSSLTEPLRNTLLDDGYAQPLYKHLLTKESQLDNLAHLRSVAVKHYNRLRRDESAMLSTMKKYLSNDHRPNHTNPKILTQYEPPTPPTTATSYLQHSAAEQTITRELRNTTQTTDFPVCPTTGYVSCYPSSFRGCYGCGEQFSHTHFKDCPGRDDKETKEKFYREYKLHSLAIQQRRQER
jgi:hypothetical protein